MEAVIVAMGILMWMWAAAALQLVRRLLPTPGPARGAWLALLVLGGAAVHVALALFVLPASILSQGWSRETLESARHGTIAVVALVAVAGVLRGWRQLDPAPTRAAPARRPAPRPPVTEAATPPAKRRP